ncbi:hypothetical protein ACOQFV_00625 [Nocardiopsis changdeensis]|uniref:LppX_LprAFG lipoprotein n=1 Tax=Nocardiopsis changdeensis TaxID=2831969 RepID=A0ABX8BMS6_9ACTN|nr:MULTISPECIES: hypothetical protein [Nocardiopsis]QUX22191.1 hypothetical protein KGD84_28210 [Nocardiopsis changdeensis]QYX38131.1 hypothetical protein K1J57_05595 [Nocardiopsis sp. MT53]
MKTRVPALFTAGILALPLAACGAEEAPEPTEEATEAAAETPAGENGGGGILDLLNSLGENTAEMTDYTFVLSMTVPDPELGELDVELTYEVMDDPQAMQITMVMPELGEMLAETLAMAGEDLGLTEEELGTQVMIVLPDGETIFSDHIGMYEADTPWVRDTGEDASDLHPDELFDIQGLPDMVGAFAGIEQAEETGTEDVDGVPTTVVEIVLTEEEAAALDAAPKAAIKDLLGGAVDESLEVSLWISEDGFPMRMSVDDNGETLEMEFSGIGTTSFEIPSEDQISDM